MNPVGGSGGCERRIGVIVKMQKQIWGQCEGLGWGSGRGLGWM